jgi:hypothetical protein
MSPSRVSGRTRTHRNSPPDPDAVDGDDAAMAVSKGEVGDERAAEGELARRHLVNDGELQEVAKFLTKFCLLPLR